jgi:hypothetical protein
MGSRPSRFRSVPLCVPLCVPPPCVPPPCVPRPGLLRVLGCAILRSSPRCAPTPFQIHPLGPSAHSDISLPFRSARFGAPVVGLPRRGSSSVNRFGIGGKRGVRGAHSSAQRAARSRGSCTGSWAIARVQHLDPIAVVGRSSLGEENRRSSTGEADSGASARNGTFPERFPWRPLSHMTQGGRAQLEAIAAFLAKLIRREPEDHGRGRASSRGRATSFISSGCSCRKVVTDRQIRLHFDLASEGVARRGIDSTMASFFAVPRLDVRGGGPTSQIRHVVPGKVSPCDVLLPLVTSNSRESGSQPDRISSVLLNAGRPSTAVRSLGAPKSGERSKQQSESLSEQSGRRSSGHTSLGPGSSGEAGTRPARECQKNLVHRFHVPGNVWWGRLQYGREIASEQ